MPRKISLINYKGGVGKTSLIVNTAACLAEKGNRVLLFDLDTQSNASIWLMRLERWNVLQSSGRGDIFSIFDPAEDTIKDCIIKDVVQDKSGKSILPGLDIVPTTFNLVDVENEYKAQRPPYAVFQEQLEEIEDNYDYILFDCPPNVLRAAQCGIFCSNEVYIPSNPDALSLIGFTLLVDKMLKFHQRSASFRKPGMGKPAQVQGIIFNAIKTGVDIDVPKMRMQFRLNQFKKQKRVGASAKIFSSIVRDAIVVRRAVTLGLPINLVGQVREEEDSVYKDYTDVAQELINHKPS
ncbi:MAG: AAA family ATPase [Opitutales bacterium]|nr:AAA family ATPase [Opitutales bacterium]